MVRLPLALIVKATRKRFAFNLFFLWYGVTLYFCQGSDFEEDGGGEAAVDMGFKIEP
jgi:hypothetical protein